MTAHLVTIETQTGVQPQIWYADRGAFAGCPQTHLTKIALPDRGEAWTIEAAVEFALANPEVSKDAR